MQYKYILTRDQVRKIDRLAIESYGVPGVILMENAGRACADEALDMLGRAAGKRVAVFCGKGNNGGDGFVIARHLSNGGADVHIFLAASAEDVLASEGDAAVNLKIVLNMGIPVTEIHQKGHIHDVAIQAGKTDLLVDALLGTGIKGEVRGLFAPLIKGLNRLETNRIGVDLPSGLDCDEGVPLGCAMRCDRTVTFVGAKRGFENPESVEYTGKVTVADIGLPKKIVDDELSA